MNIENYSIQELQRLQSDAAALIDLKKDEAVIAAYEQINAIAKNIGLTVQEILEFGDSLKVKKPRKPVEIRYRNKSNLEETWTGRGKQPRWLASELNKGAKLEDFLI